jgi:hypothetical protein
MFASLRSTFRFARSVRLGTMAATAGAAWLLSGCVVAPVGPRPYAVYPARPVYVEPVAPAVVVVPPPVYYGRGYYGGYGGYYGGYGGYYGGHRGYGHRR